MRVLQQEVAELEVKKKATMEEVNIASYAFLVDAKQMDEHLR